MKLQKQIKTIYRSEARGMIFNGIKGLKNPPYQAMGTEDRLLHACLCAYRKHHCGNDDIGWNELGDILHNALCEAMGDERFVEWNERNERNDWNEQSPCETKPEV